MMTETVQIDAPVEHVTAPAAEDGAKDQSAQLAETTRERNEIICALIRRLVGSESENLSLLELLDRHLSDTYRLRLSLAGQDEQKPADIFGVDCAMSDSRQFERADLLVTANAMQSAKTLDEITPRLMSWLGGNGDKRRSLPELLDLIRLNIYRATLNEYGHSHRKAANILGINRNMLWRRLNQAKRRSKGDTLQPAEILDEVTQYFMNCLIDRTGKQNSLPLLLDGILMNIYRVTLDECGHSHRKTAITLGINRNTLYRQVKLAEHRILNSGKVL